MATPDVPSTGALAGRVLEVTSQRPLVFSNVVILGTIHGTVTRSPDGSFLILGVPPGSYKVKASFVGHLPQTLEDVRVARAETTRVEFCLAENLDSFRTRPVRIDTLPVEYIAEKDLLRNMCGLHDPIVVRRFETTTGGNLCIILADSLGTTQLVSIAAMQVQSLEDSIPLPRPLCLGAPPGYKVPVGSGFETVLLQKMRSWADRQIDVASQDSLLRAANDPAAELSDRKAVLGRLTGTQQRALALLALLDKLDAERRGYRQR
jgi:hypothetical protein